MILDPRRKLTTVMSQLAQLGDRKKDINESSTFVSCPFHAERTPSCRVFHFPTDKNPGGFKCYGCGKTGSWNELAPALGLKPFKWVKPDEQFAAQAIRATREKAERPRRLVLEDLPTGKLWRSIKTDLLIEVGCRKGRFFYEDAEVYGKPFVYMPVLVGGDLRGFIRAAIKKPDDGPSYINSPGGWTKDYGLFPYDYTVPLARKLKYVVLVEGQRDALRLLGLGIPALAILGTQSWSHVKSRLVDMIGADLVVIMMDGDDAGIDAIELLQLNLKMTVNTMVFTLSGKDSPYWPYRKKAEPSKAAKREGVELWDPFNAPLKKLKQLKQQVHNALTTQ